MSMSDCPKCWDTPCTCGWEYRDYSVHRLYSMRNMFERIAMFKELNPNAVFSKFCSPQTEDDKKFMDFMSKRS